MNERKLGTVLSYVNIGVNTVVNLLYVPLLLFYIGQSEYGLYKLLGSFIAYFGLMDFGLNSAVVRFYTKYLALREYQRMENLLGMAAYFYIGIITIVLIFSCVVYFCLGDIFGDAMTMEELEEAHWIFAILALNVIASFGGQVFSAVIVSHERFVLLKVSALLNSLLRPVLVVVLLHIYPKAIMVVLAQTFFNLLTVLVNVVYAYKKLNIRIHYYGWDSAMFSEIKKLAGSVFVVFVVDQVFWQTNQVILGMYAGTTVVAVYAVAAQIYMNYYTFATVIPGMFGPKLTSMVALGASNRELSEYFIKIGRLQYMLIGVLLGGFIVFGREFINFWAGDGFGEAYWITLLIICPFTIDLIQNLGLSILQAENRYGFRALVYFCIGAVNLVLVVPVAKMYGGIGCAAVTGCMMFLGNGIIMNYYYYKYVGLDIKLFWQNIAKISLYLLLVTAAGAGLNFVFTNEGIAFFGIKIAIFILLYAACLYKFTMNTYERGLLAGVLQRLKRKAA